MVTNRAGTTVLALPTQWHGTTFRSRLEARWAIFLDAADVRWLYEPEGFALPSGAYLPDFRLPDLDAWLEIKPEGKNEKAEHLLWELGDATNSRAFLAYGFPDPERVGVGGPVTGGYDNGALVKCAPEWDNNHAFTVCGICTTVDIQFEGRSERVACHRNLTEKFYGGSHSNLMTAYREAWGTRFESGSVAWSR